MYKLILSKPLQKFTNNIKSVTIDGDSYFNLYSNLTNLFPDLKRTTDELKFNKYGDIWFLVDGKILSLEKVFLQPKKNVDIVIVPIIAGSGQEELMIGVGVAIMIVGIITLQPELVGLSLGMALGEFATIGTLLATMEVASTIGWALVSMGVGMALSGVLAATSTKSSKTAGPSTDSGARRGNDAFEGLVNTTSTQMPIPLIYGHHRVAGQFISGKIRTINHDKGTYISVANYI